MNDSEEEAGRQLFDVRIVKYVMPIILAGLGGFCALISVHVGDIDARLNKVVLDEAKLEATVASHDRIFIQVNEINSRQITVLQDVSTIKDNIQVNQKRIDQLISDGEARSRDQREAMKDVADRVRALEQVVRNPHGGL